MWGQTGGEGKERVSERQSKHIRERFLFIFYFFCLQACLSGHSSLCQQLSLPHTAEDIRELTKELVQQLRICIQTAAAAAQRLACTHKNSRKNRDLQLKTESLMHIKHLNSHTCTLPRMKMDYLPHPNDK